MSRFFYSLDTSESDYSSSDESISSQEQQAEEDNQRPGFNEFLRGASDESDVDDEKKVVKSAKLKKTEELRGLVTGIEQYLFEGDWNNVTSDFDKLLRLITKYSSIFNGKTPRFFARLLVDLEDELNDAMADKESLKKMNATNARGLNSMKQKLKKALKSFEKDVEKFKENPVTAEDSANEDQEADQESDQDVKAPVVKQPTPQGARMPSKLFFDRLEEILALRGKKNTDKGSQVENLSSLLTEASTPYQQLKCLMALIPARFDYVPPNGYMSTEMWYATLGEIDKLHDILDANTHIKIADVPEDDSEPNHEKDKRVTDGEACTITGILTTFVDRLDDEFTKSLQNIDPHTTEYIDRLRDEAPLYALMVRTQIYSENIGIVQDGLDLIIMRRVEHLYYKPDIVIQKIEEGVRKTYPTIKLKPISVDLVQSLCSGLCKSAIERVKTRATLCNIYHLALHDQYSQARDMMLMNRLQDTIHQADIQTQALYNRCIVQIGLSAFRNGIFREAHSTLQEIYSSGKYKELLAQGSQKQSEKSAEQEKIEKQRQLPFHMHINLELLESVYLTCAMLLEVPNMAQRNKKTVISKAFRRYLDYNERQTFTGRPENIRDHVMAAAKQMAQGNWEDCFKYIQAIKVWDLLPNAQKVNDMLKLKIQQETLKTHVFYSFPYYSNISLDSLAEMFSLSVDQVESLVSQLILYEDVPGQIDKKTRMLIISNISKQSKFEQLTLQYIDKLAQMIDITEKHVEHKNAHLANIKSK